MVFDFSADPTEFQAFRNDMPKEQSKVKVNSNSAKAQKTAVVEDEGGCKCCHCGSDSEVNCKGLQAACSLLKLFLTHTGFVFIGFEESYLPENEGTSATATQK